MKYVCIDNHVNGEPVHGSVTSAMIRDIGRHASAREWFSAIPSLKYLEMTVAMIAKEIWESDVQKRWTRTGKDNFGIAGPNDVSEAENAFSVFEMSTSQ